MNKKLQKLIAVKKGFGSKGIKFFSASLAVIILLLSFNIDAYALDWDKRVALVNAAQAELDAGERDYDKAGNNKYGYWYADKMGRATFKRWVFWDVPYSSVPWCTIFVSYCAEQAGIGTEDIPLEMSTPNMYNWYVDNDKFRAKGTYIPEPGDLVFFEDDKGLCHVGIVKSVQSTSIPAENYTCIDAMTVIDGNNGNAVTETTYYEEKTNLPMWIKGYGVN